MNPYVGLGLAALALVFGWQLYGVRGLAFAVTLIAFWLLLQFNRSVRVLRNASGAPVGYIASAVMLNAKLQPRMHMTKVLTITKSLGERRDAAGDVLAWTDEGGAEVVVTFANGRITSWVLTRPQESAE